MNFPRLLKLARAIGLTSDHHSHKMGAVIFDKRGRTISTSANHLFKTHPEYAKINSLKTLHAEASAILKVRHKVDLRGCSILVYRETKDGCLANARPCEGCLKIIKLYNLKRIFYTKDNQILEERVK